MLLGEKVGPPRWPARGMGFSGVLLIVRPGTATFDLGSIFILISVLFYALNVILTRKLKDTDSSATMSYYSSLVYLVAAFILSPLAILVGKMPNAHPSIAFLFRAWAMPTLLDWGIISGLGLVWAGGMYFIARAYSTSSTTSLVAPFEYTTLPINVMWDFFLWHEIPTWMTWQVGVLLTIFRRMYVLWQNKQPFVKEIVRGPGLEALKIIFRSDWRRCIAAKSVYNE